jgi:general secretion pathway protein D
VNQTKLVKTIYSLFLVLLFAPLVDAQTNRGTTNSPLALPTTVPRRTIPGRAPISTNAIGTNRFSHTNPLATNVVTNAVTRSTTTSTSTNISKKTSTNVVTAPNPATAPNPLAPPTVGAAPSATAKTTARTNAAGEVASYHYNYQAMPLEQILEQYSALVGRTLLRGTGLVPTLPITLQTQGDLTRSEAITALETVLAMNGVTFIPIGEKFAKVVLEPQAPTAGGPFSEADAKDLPDAGKYVTHIVQLKYAQAQEVQQVIANFAKTPASVIALATSNTLILRDYSENVKRMLEVIKQIDVVSELNVKPEVIPIKYALASDISQVLGSLTASGPGLSVGRSSNRGAGVTPGGYQPGAIGASPTIGQPSAGYNGQPGQQPGQSAMGSSATRSGQFQRNLQNIVSRISAGAGEMNVIGNAKIIADERTNSLLIFANDQDMIMIKTIISQLDVVLAQVLIEAVIMEVSLDNDKKIGVSYLQQPRKTGTFTGAGGVNNGQAFPTSGTNGAGAALTDLAIQNLPSGFSYFGSFGNDLDVAVAAIATDSRVNVLSRPRIQTSHAVPATLFIGDTVPYITGTSSYLNANGGTSSTYQEKRVGITLDVLPLINPDGLVVMDIQQNIQQLGPNQIIDGNPVPTTTERSAQAKVAVRDRETIILGGFISTTKSKSKSGVPYLKDIPGLGILFRSSDDQMKRVELIVLLRPTVLPTPEAAALVAATERDKLSGVKQGEFEIREEERKRQEALDAEMRKKLGIKDRPL